MKLFGECGKRLFSNLFFKSCPNLITDDKNKKIGSKKSLIVKKSDDSACARELSDRFEMNLQRQPNCPYRAFIALSSPVLARKIDLTTISNTFLIWRD